MALGRWFSKGDRQARAAADLYVAVVEQARRPGFYRRHRVPDTVDGRFELIALHTFLVLHRLTREGDRTRDLAQALFDRLFADMDRSLREMGAGDMGVGKRIQHMAQAFYGRMAAYRQALAGDDAALEGALRRNLYGTVPEGALPTAAMARYVRETVDLLAGQPAAALEAGTVHFPAMRDD
jgi:cytochrome b pre-mRNA-processing protein 3